MPCRRLAALVCAVGTTLVATCGPSAAPTSTGSSPSGAAQPPAAGAAPQGTGAAAPAGASADSDRGVADPQNWKDNKLKWVDPEQQYLLQTTEQMGSGITVNPDAIPPGTITSWRDLLKPEYKGKIAAFDPRLAGVGLALATYLYIQFGEDFIKPLYLQQAILTGEERQLAEWVGRGVYPIGLGVVPRQVAPLSALGLKFQRVYPPDGPG